LLIPLTIYVLWIYAFNFVTTQVERITIFKDYFPDFLNDRWDTTFISIAFCVVAILLSTVNLKKLKIEKSSIFEVFLLSNYENTVF